MAALFFTRPTMKKRSLSKLLLWLAPLAGAGVTIPPGSYGLYLRQEFLLQAVV
jgi:hypothetical protein